MPALEPTVMVWARTTAGLSLEGAALKLGIKAVREKTGEERLAEIEAGTVEPTRAQVARMSEVYRRPLIAFYLDRPPTVAGRGQDFRTLPAEYAESEDALVDALLRDVCTRQGIVRELLIDEDEAVELDFVGSMRVEDGAPAILAAIQRRLKLDVGDFRKRRPESGFDYLREMAEAAGVFVLLIGNLGSHHSAISTELFRGFALADPIAPFIVINDQDSRRAWSFTLLHELAHVWLGQTGVSGANTEAAVERLCDAVAALFLLPEHSFNGLEIPAEATRDELLPVVAEIAELTGASYTAVAFMLHQNGHISWPAFRELQLFYRERWLANKVKSSTAESSGPNYYVVRRHRLGPKLIGFSGRMMSSGALVPSKAAQVLGVRPNSVPKLLAPPQQSHRAA